jgi:hypothetical protein
LRRVDLVDEGQRVGGDAEGAGNFGQAALDERLHHLVERIGIEHGIAATHEPQVAVEPAIGDRAVGDERRAKPVAGPEPVETVGVVTALATLAGGSG